MRNFTPRLLFGCLLLLLISCSKEKSIDTLGVTPGSSNNGDNGGNNNSGGTSTGSELGTWTFINLHATTLSSVEINTGFGIEKANTVSDYITQNNAGTITFDGSKMTATGLAYDVNATATTYMYTNNVLDDSLSLPFTASIPSSNATATYKKVTADSIYIQSGVFNGMDPNGGNTQTMPAGYRLKWDGDKMYMSMSYTQTTSQVVSGITQKTTMRISSVTTLQKK